MTPTLKRSSSEKRRRIPFTVDTTIILLLLSYRVINALTIKTFFQPDEYYQSLEPAWDLVLGNGWITWVSLREYQASALRLKCTCADWNIAL